MGDMAEFWNESHGDFEDDDYDYNDYGYYPRTNIECAYCGKREHHWVITAKGNWCLANDKGKIHDCRERMQLRALKKKDKQSFEHVWSNLVFQYHKRILDNE
jgi:hypothetical protein